MGMIGPNVPFGGLQGCDNTPAAGGDSKSQLGPYVPFDGAQGWEQVWNTVMGNLLDFYDIDLEHPFKGMLNAVPPGGDPTAFNLNA